MAYSADSFVAFEQPSLAKWQKLWSNDASFHDGTGIAGLYKNLLTVDSNPYKFSAYRNAAWTSGSPAIVQFDAELYDTNANFDTVTNKGRYTAPVAGFYCFSSTCEATISGGGYGAIQISKNGSTTGTPKGTGGLQGATGGFAFAATITVPSLQLAANDYIEISFYGSGGAGSTGAANTWFSGCLMYRT